MIYSAPAVNAYCWHYEDRKEYEVLTPPPRAKATKLHTTEEAPYNIKEYANGRQKP